MVSGAIVQKPMFKKIALFSIAFVLLFGAGAFLYLDAAATRAIAVVGGRALGTEVRVSTVTISPLNGAGSINDLRIGNPEGFNAEYVFELGYVSVDFDASTFFSDVIRFESITIAQPVINYETHLITDNIRTLLANLEGKIAASVSAPATDASNQRIIIQQLNILNPQLILATGAVTAPHSLPDIILRDLGTGHEAASVEQVLQAILTASITSIQQAIK